ncbi:hypothetical protein O0I10_012273, partial [Lichtheimia ornata]
MYHSRRCAATRLLHSSLRYTHPHTRSKPTCHHGAILPHHARDLHSTATTLDPNMDPYPNLSERLNDEEITAAYDGKASTETLEERSEQELHTSDAKATEKNALRNHIMNQFSEHLQGKKQSDTIVIKKHQPSQSADVKHVLAKFHAAPQEPKYHKINFRRRYTPIQPEGEDKPQPPTLAHGLDRVLFNPGVHYLKDPRTQTYNFTPFLENITPPAEFDYDAIGPYITPSQDEYLIQRARDHQHRYVGSTSSVSAMLSQIYFALSNGKPTDTSVLSRAYFSEPNKYTRATRAPASIFLHWKDGVYGIDADKSYDVEETILSSMGKSMEKVLTLEPPEYERYLKNADAPLSPQEVNQPESFAYGV